MKYSSEVAEKYSKQRNEYNETDDLLFNNLEEIGITKKNILDLGCGDGRHASRMIEIGASEVVGIDINEKMIDLAKSKYSTTPNIEFKLANGNKIPLKEKSVDIVVSNFVLHYFKNFNEIFKEISRVLEKDGYFVGTFNITDVEEGLEKLYNTPMPIKLGSGENHIIVENLIKSRDELEKAIKETGFKIIKEEELHHPNATVDQSFDYADKITKHAIIIVLQKTSD